MGLAPAVALDFQVPVAQAVVAVLAALQVAVLAAALLAGLLSLDLNCAYRSRR